MFCSHLQVVAKSLRRPCTPRGSNVTPQHCKHAPIAVCAHASKHSTLHLEANEPPASWNDQGDHKKIEIIVTDWS